MRFYRARLPDEVGQGAFGRLTGADTDMAGFVAERDERLVGFVNLVVHASTWAPAGRARVTANPPRLPHDGHTAPAGISRRNVSTGSQTTVPACLRASWISTGASAIGVAAFSRWFFRMAATEL